MNKRTFKDVINEAKWVQGVETKYSPPEGTFTKSADEIAKQMHKDAPDYETAVRRIDFFYNRSKGKEDDAKRKQVLTALRKLYGKENE